MLRITNMVRRGTKRAAVTDSVASLPAPRRSARLSSLPPAPSPPAEIAPIERTAKPKRAKKQDDNDGEITFKHGTLSRKHEQAKLATGKYKFVVGTDEAGRGPLAGPVVAAACYIPPHVTIEGIHDSKKLSEPQRELLYEQLTSHPEIQYAVHANSAQRIDEINILQASLEAMAKAVDALAVPADFVFVDGNRMPSQLTVDAETVIQGDSKVYSIAAASVIAKVTRDRLMVELDAQYPQYNLKQHKGYPTREHMAAITKHGACPAIHRMTFAPIKPKTEKKKSKK